MNFLTIKRNVPRTRPAAASGRSQHVLAATARRGRLVHSLLRPPLSIGSALPLQKDTASCLRLPILPALRREPPATSVRTSQSRPTSAAFVEPCARFFTHPVPLLPWFALPRALLWFGLVWFRLFLSFECLVHSQLKLSNHVTRILNHSLDSLFASYLPAGVPHAA